MSMLKMHFPSFQKITAVIVHLSFLFQNLLAPFAFLSYAQPVQAGDQPVVEVSFNKNSHSLDVVAKTVQSANLSLSYRHPENPEPEGIIGTLQVDAEHIGRGQFLAGTKSGDQVIPHEVQNGDLQLVGTKEDGSDFDLATHFVMKNDSLWVEQGSDTYTTYSVEVDHTYTAPQDDEVQLTFKSLPENPGYLQIQKLQLSEEQQAMLGAVSSVAYDITSDMPDGSFSYDLTLPNPAPDKEVVVQYSEDGDKFKEVTSVTSENSLEIEDLNHFTVFVVTTPPTLTGTGCVNVGGTDGCYDSIQAAIDAVDDSDADPDTIMIKNGHYSLSSTLRINKQVTLLGESETGVNIDGSGNGKGYGVLISADNVTLKNVTILPPTVPASMGTSNGGGYAIHVSNTPNLVHNLTLENITIENGNRTSFDLHGVDGGSLKNLTARNNVYGNGLSLTGSSNITVEDFTSSGNAWGGIALYTSTNTDPDRATHNITLLGNTFSIAEDNAIYEENENGLTITNIDAQGYDFRITNDQYRTGAENFVHYQASLTNAKNFALDLQSINGNTASVIHQVSTGDYHVAEGMKIQEAIDAASSGDTINILPGTFAESINLNKSLNILGPNANLNPQTEIRGTEAIIQGQSSSTINISADGVTLDGLFITNSVGNVGISITNNSHILIENNIIADIQSANSTVEAISILPNANDISDITIQHNIIRGIHYTGNLDPGFSVDGIVIGWSNNSNSVLGLVIDGNRIHNIRSNTSAWKIGHGANGVKINIGSSGAGQVIAPQITNNSIYDLDGLWSHAIGLEGNTPNAVVKGNSFSQLVDHKDPTDAVAVMIEDNASANTVHINNNTFESTVPVGVRNMVDGSTVDARNNNWITTTFQSIENRVQHDCNVWKSTSGLSGLTCDSGDSSDKGVVNYKNPTGEAKSITFTSTNNQIVGGNHSVIKLEVEAKYTPYEVDRVRFRFAPPGQTCKQQYTSPYAHDLGDGAKDGDLYSVDWNVNGLPSGTYSACALMHRNTGSTSEGFVNSNYAELTVLVDNSVNDIPSLQTPAHEAIVSGNPTQTWSKVAEADHYIYESYTDDSFSNLIYHTIVKNNSRSVGGNQNITFWWRVKAVDTLGNESDWSVARKMTIDNKAPAIPDLVAPANGSVIRPQLALLDWTDVSDDHGPVTYNYQSFWGTSGHYGPRSTNTISQIDASASQDRKYKWQVQACDAIGNCSAWSPLWEVTIDSVAPSVPNNLHFLDYQGNNLGCGGFTNHLSTTVDWDDVSDVIGYEYTINYPFPKGSGRGQWTTYPKQSQYGGSLNQGEHIVKVRAIDAAGNKSEWTTECSLTADTVAPAKPTWGTIYTDHGVNPTNEIGCGGYTNNPQVTFEWNMNPENDIKGYWFGTKFNQKHQWINVGNIKKASMTPGNNPYFYTIIAVDNANNESEISDQCGLTLDQEIPTSTITTPLESTASATLITNDWDGHLAGTASDNESHVTTVKLSIQRSNGDYWDGSNWVANPGNEILFPANGTTTWDYVLTSPAPDNYSVKSHAIDAAGNQENTAELYIIYDKTIPEVSLTTNPAEPDGENGWFVTRPVVTLTATDANGVSAIEYQWDNEAAWTLYTQPFPVHGEGSHLLTYRAIDAAGNASQPGLKTLRYDATELTNGPLNMSVSPNPTNQKEVTVKWEAAKDNTSIVRYDVNWSENNGNRSFGKTFSSDVFETTIDQLREGEWTVKVKAFDGAGHFVETTKGLTIDTTPPHAPSLNLGGYSGGTVTLNWNDVENGDDYIVLYGTNPGNYPYAKRFGDVTSATISDLNNGPYYFVVKAEDKAKNASGDSNEVSTSTESTVPAGTITQPEGPVTGFEPAEEVLGTNTQTQDKDENEPANQQGEVLGASIKNPFTWWWLAFVFYAIMMLITYVMVGESKPLRILGNVLSAVLASYLLYRWLPQPLPWVATVWLISTFIEGLTWMKQGKVQAAKLPAKK